MPAVRNIHKLIDFFSSHTVLPIDPDDVRDQILSFGIKDEIEFVGVDFDTRVIYGAFHQFIRRDGVYGDTVVHVDVYYDRSLMRDWKRLVCCKELLHMLDSSASKATAKEACENLFVDFANLSINSPFSAEKLLAWNDELMTFYAVAILLPWDAREILRQDYLENNNRLAEIVKKVDLPEALVRMVLSDSWPKMYATLSGSE